MSNITSSEYYTELNNLAEDIAKELLEEHDNDLDEAQQEAYDHIHETVDGHEWIIYERYHANIVAHSSNDEAYQHVYCAEDLGTLIVEKGLDHIIMVQAFYAMTQDLSELVYDALEAAHEEVTI